jgi:hypothetical protein
MGRGFSSTRILLIFRELWGLGAVIVGSGGFLHRGVRGHLTLWDLGAILSSTAGGSKRAPEMSLNCYLSIAMTVFNQD